MLEFSTQLVKKAASEFPTPFYLYDGEILLATYRRLKKLIPEQMDIYYSMKANPLLGICELFSQEQSGCEVCSAAEFLIALRAGFPSDKIIFVGPGKSRDELALCVEHDIYAVVCESLIEMDILNTIAMQQQKFVRVLTRINPLFNIPSAPLKMSGKATQFGIDVDQLRVINPHKKFSNLNIVGIQIYNGTRILNAQDIINNTLKILDLADELSESWQTNFTCIDIGGGFGIPYFAGESELDIDKIFNDLGPHLHSYVVKHPTVKFILESGRYLVATAGVFVTRVRYTKTSHGEKFLVTDGGMNCHLAVTGLGSFVKRNFPISSLSLKEKKELTDRNADCLYQICGPLCTPGDTIAKQISLPPTTVGDFIVIANVGAYGPSASPGRFLSHGFPAEIIAWKNNLYTLKRAETIVDFLSTQYSLPN